eukprot:762514-Hanusia_phi.AAC.10
MVACLGVYFGQPLMLEMIAGPKERVGLIEQPSAQGSAASQLAGNSAPTYGQQDDVCKKDGKADRDASCLAAPSCHRSFPHHVAEQKGHGDFSSEGRAVTELRIDDVGS